MVPLVMPNKLAVMITAALVNMNQQYDLFENKILKYIFY